MHLLLGRLFSLFGRAREVAFVQGPGEKDSGDAAQQLEDGQQ